MKKHSTWCGATMLTALLALPLAPAVAASAALAGNVSAWAIPANQTGIAADSRRVDIAVHMRLRDIDGLRAFVAVVSQPGRPMYGHYLSKQAFGAAFAPAAADVQAVRTLLENAGMANVSIGPANAYVTATATVAQLRSTFGVSQNVYAYAGRTLRANAEAPTLPAALAAKVLFIEGLDDSDLLRVPLHHSAMTEDKAPAAPANMAPASARAVTPPPVADELPSPYCSNYYGDHQATLTTKPGPYAAKLPWLVCGYTPQQIHQAYGLNKVSQYNGAGVTIGIIDAYASPTIQDDANRYATNHQLPQLRGHNFSQIVPKGIYNVSPSESCGPYGWWGEESLDVAAAHGAAPGANIVYIGARDCNTSLSTAYLDAIYNKTADILTNSYSFNGEAVSADAIATLDQGAMAAAAEGITVLFSSGDDGDLSQVNGVATGAYESTGQYVTAVGGTSLALYGPSGSKGEWGWGNARAFLADATVNSATSITTSGLETATNYGLTYYDFSFYAGSGGGISLVETQPSYQSGIVPPYLALSLNEASGNTVSLPTAMRVAPDVSMVADPYTGYLYGESYTVSGNGYSDTGCTSTGSGTEYCEASIGGTSLASPLMAGMIAVVDQARIAAGKAKVGFANPWLYTMNIGTSLTAAGINDVTAPNAPQAMLRGYVTNLSEVRVVTINSVPQVIYLSPFPLEVCGSTICEGVNDVFNDTTIGYDDVTGLGVPYAPMLINQ